MGKFCLFCMERIEDSSCMLSVCNKVVAKRAVELAL